MDTLDIFDNLRLTKLWENSHEHFNKILTGPTFLISNVTTFMFKMCIILNSEICGQKKKHIAFLYYQKNLEID